MNAVNSAGGSSRAGIRASRPWHCANNLEAERAPAFLHNRHQSVSPGLPEKPAAPALMLAFLRSALILAVFSHCAAAGEDRPVMPRPENDDFAQRKVLPAAEHVTYPIGDVTGVSFEALDPLLEQFSGAEYLKGSLWWSWQAPRDGWFVAETTGAPLEDTKTYVFRGESLETLLPVRNGNFLGLSTFLYRTVFEAKQGERFSVGVQGLWPNLPASAGQNTGTLVIRPCPAPPANFTLATRAPLEGPLPLAFTTSNVVEQSRESALLYRLQPLEPERGIPYVLSGVLWWEWRCPATARYRFTAEGPWGLYSFAAARRRLPGNPDGEPGNWESDGIAPAARTFHAQAGRVYDIALASQGDEDEYTYVSFDEIAVRLETVTEPPAENTERSKAIALPGIVPQDITLDLQPGDVTPEDGGSYVRLWWKYTAPAAGVYDLGNAGSQNVFRENGVQDDDVYFVLRENETIWIGFYVRRLDRLSVNVRITRFVPPLNDRLEDAEDLGNAQSLELEGHHQLSTVDAGEPPIENFHSPQPVTGSLWWKWTAPADGLLSNEAGEGWTYLELFEGATIPSLKPAGSLVNGLSPRVKSGTAYLIRAAEEARTQSGGFSRRLRFVPAPAPADWTGATDLGITDFPQWKPAQPVYASGGNFTWNWWFKWTAKSGGATFIHSFGDGLKVFTDPAQELELAREPESSAWELEAGRTYWLNVRTGNPSVWFSAQPVRRATSVDPASAKTLGPALPSAGAASFYGDVNSSVEIGALSQHIRQQDLARNVPVIWWKWQCPEDQWVRMATYQFGGWSQGTFVFAGEVPAPANAVKTITAARDDYAQYFPAVRGKTYWIAVAGIGKFDESVIRLELWPAVSSAVPNDSFALRTEISNEAWRAQRAIFGAHLMAGATHPLKFQHHQASIEPGEPPVSLLIGEDGTPHRQTRTTWWSWTAPASGIFKFNLASAWEEAYLLNDGWLPLNTDLKDLSASVFTGDALPSLRPVALYEPKAGLYLFRAEKDRRYSIRVATSEETRFYGLVPQAPNVLEIYDFAAVERLEFDEIGRALEDDAGDGVPNYMKHVFGLNRQVRFDSPLNGAARKNLPRLVESPDFLELRMRPLQHLTPAGDPELLWFTALVSTDLENWQMIQAVPVGDGELAVRLPKSEGRGFIMHGLSNAYQFIELHE